MNHLFWLFALLGSGTFSPIHEAQPEIVECGHIVASPKAPHQLGQFSFLIGQHDITLHAWAGDQWTPPRPTKAQWHGWYGLEGLAVYDEWSDPDVTQGNIGVNVRLYDDKEDIWKMMWISSSGRQVQDLRAKNIDGALTMWQVHPARIGWKAIFEVIDSGSWARVSYIQNSVGIWQPEFKLIATRTSCNV